MNLMMKRLPLFAILARIGRWHAIAVCFMGVLLNISIAHAEKTPLPEESCADGYYSGPRAGRKNYSHDKYQWVVTPEFAKRFCMPPEFVDKGLKGAEAIAFRMSTSTGGFDRCAVIDGNEKCSDENELRFDIFLRSDLNLPAANPEVKFYDGSWDDAGEHIFVNERRSRWQQYKSGEYRPPPGAIPHFMNPFFQPDEGYIFGLVRVHQGKGIWSIAGLDEWSYRANWAKGLDLLVLQADRGGGFGGPHLQAPGISYAIVMGTLDTWVSGLLKNSSHTIWLPERFYEKVYAAATAKDKSWLEQLPMLRQQ